MKKKYSQENETCKYQSVKESREKYEQKLEPLAKKISEMSGINLDECRRKKKPISILTLLKKTEMFKRLIDYNKAIAYLVISEYSSHRIGVQETRGAGLYSIDGSFFGYQKNFGILQHR